MRFIAVTVALLASFVGCSACSTRAVPLDLPGIPQERDPTLALSTSDGGAGHACPVENFIITAKHVVYDEDEKAFVGAAWSDDTGAEGTASVLWAHPSLDLAVLATRGAGPHYLPKGDVVAGDLVFWWEFDFRTRENALRSRRRFAHVLRVVAQLIILDDVPVAGASGSCLVNVNGEVVGIVNSAWYTDDGRNVGAAIKLVLTQP